MRSTSRESVSSSFRLRAHAHWPRMQFPPVLSTHLIMEKGEHRQIILCHRRNEATVSPSPNVLVHVEVE